MPRLDYELLDYVCTNRTSHWLTSGDIVSKIPKPLMVNYSRFHSKMGFYETEVLRYNQPSRTQFWLPFAINRQLWRMECVAFYLKKNQTANRKNYEQKTIAFKKGDSKDLTLKPISPVSTLDNYIRNR